MNNYNDQIPTSMPPYRDDIAKAYGFVHVHSTWSLQDAVASIDEICKKASEMGAKGVTITDHGNCAGWISFLSACQKYGLKAGLGTEGYLRFTPHGEYEGHEIQNIPPINHAHVVLIAMNYTGLQELSQLMTAAQANCESIGGLTQPIITKELIQKYLKSGNVIATSACISGPLSDIYFMDKVIDKQIASKRSFQSRYDIPDREDVIEKKQRIAEMDADIQALNTEQDALKPDAKISLTKLEKGLKTLKNESIRANNARLALKREDFLTEEMYQQGIFKYEQAAVSAQRDYDAALQAFEEATQKKTYATARIKEIKGLLTYLKSTKSIIKEEIKPYVDALKKYDEFQSAIDELELKRHSREEILVLMKNEIQWFKATFGNKFFIEMQYHGIPEEAEVMPVLAQFAEEFDVPLVATNDSHLISREQTQARHTLLSLRYEKWAKEFPQDEECYMKSDNELSAMLRKILPENTVQKAMMGIHTIIDACDVSIPKDTHYPRYRDDTGRTLTDEEAEALLRKLTEDGAKALFPEGLTQQYRERRDYELSVIINMGFVHYFLIVWDYVSYALRLADKTMGYGVGTARGSGGGSLVLYLLRVTAIDPMVYGLIFERFLNPARVTMPDIDVDFSAEVREPTIKYMRDKYGEELVARIRTVMVMGAKDSIHNAARVIGYRESQIDKSMTKEQKEKAEKRRKHIQSLGNRLASAIKNPSQSLKDDTVREMLYSESADPLTKEIVDRAAAIEGCAKSFSMHAAGVVISDGEPLGKYIPLMRIVSSKKDTTDDELSMYDTNGKAISEEEGQLATACDMIQLEGTLKLLKFDFLGLNNLNVLSETKRRIYHNYGIVVDWNTLPIEPEVIQNIYTKGNTGNVFQVESEGMRNLFIRMEPKSLEDIILGIAAYRPGPIDFIPDIIKVKQGKKTPHYIIPELKNILGVTYGYPIYQEQLMDIFHKCAGFSLPEADNIRRLMSKKKKEEFVKFKPQFIDGLVNRGATSEDAEQLWDSLLGFASYAFNKSHAAAYTIISYATAYAKYHYPVEYMASVLNWPADKQKVPKILRQCREMGIKIIPPDIARSFMRFEDENGKILYGLSVIKGTDTKNVSEIIEKRNNEGNFRSFQDFILRAHRNSATTTRLIEGGAFDTVSPVSRAALIEALPKAIALKSEYDTACQNNGQESAQAKAKKAELLEMLIPDVEEDKRDKADREHSALGAYITSHPMDEYENVYRDGIRPLRDVREGTRATYVGIVSELKIFHRSTDGAPFAKFTLEDKTGTLQCIMFTDAYAKEGKTILRNGIVVNVEGNVEVSEDSSSKENQDAEQAEELKTFLMKAKKVTLCKKILNPFLISAPTEGYFRYYAFPFLRRYLSDEGHPCILYEKDTGRTIPLPFRITPQSMHENIPGISIKSQRHN